MVIPRCTNWAVARTAPFKSVPTSAGVDVATGVAEATTVGVTLATGLTATVTGVATALGGGGAD